MGNKIKMQLSTAQLAEALGLPTLGPDLAISTISPITELVDGALSFSTKSIHHNLTKTATIIVSHGEDLGTAAAILSKNPRLDYARALQWIGRQGGIMRPTSLPQIHPTVQIGERVTIGKGVTIGAHTIILNNVVIGDGVQIGERCVIKSSAVIGEDGFGFERDEQGIPIRLLHIGSVIIGNDVEVGSLTTICRGTIVNTIIEDHVKIDDHVHVGHNVIVHRGAIITACVILGGRARIGELAWVGPNASIIQNVDIGADALIGIGSNVTQNVEAGTVVVGNPAKFLRMNTRI